MFQIIVAGGWVMLPILLCSIAALAIIGERFWSLQRKYIIPKGLINQVWKRMQEGNFDKKHLEVLRNNSPLGKMLAAAIAHMHHDREMMKSGISEVTNEVVHDLEKYLNTLGTIAEISPLLGLLGTVTGIISMFAAVGEHGLGNPAVLSNGLSEALITTAAGLFVAIPTFVFYRYFRGKVDQFLVDMEQETLKMIDIIHGEREAE
ncbi:MotA/TolQ/ExbB proton channel family protein [Beggiatoa leptomitoformis]|uniref:MotA/TolQ/ExbB proton channel family protein n=1 Tax=Beggiatoa leptomitoformis TaxID=288004 RepID=A0A2N9YJ82_9GAMM|nr:MotA/TolQ/ExbB proton channel family protein [Beggiatoa leptomitoformis]ALG69552.2 MotA/TolQ/ExbB proton channel family protein [Beggiatoa leptomitoformis]AUI70560.2 MotA/TolQ/ExbB proton channel family protein [Beggiatoa leptomitoformis]